MKSCIRSNGPPSNPANTLMHACFDIYSPCFQALQQLSRRTLTSSARRLVENKVPQKQKLFQVSWWYDSLLMTDNGFNQGICMKHVFHSVMSVFMVSLSFFMPDSISEGLKLISWTDQIYGPAHSSSFHKLIYSTFIWGKNVCVSVVIRLQSSPVKQTKGNSCTGYDIIHWARMLYAHH